MNKIKNYLVERNLIKTIADYWIKYKIPMHDIQTLVKWYLVTPLKR